MSHEMTAPELVQLVQRVFRPGPKDRAAAVLVDLPDRQVPDHQAWRERRELAADWARKLSDERSALGLERVDLAFYRNARRNNADLPAQVQLHTGGARPTQAEDLQGELQPMDGFFADHSILLVPAEFSATAPLKLAARQHGFRAASMPGFNPQMIPALRLDYEEIDRRCREIKRLVDAASAARLDFVVEGRERSLSIDLRHRQGTASGGLLQEPGVAGNLPSGETYIVPYEGEIEGDPSRTAGVLPLELDGELMEYVVEGNRVVQVEGDGPRAAEERREVESEPAYSNIAELGLGVLGEYGVQPIGELLLDEKLGLHVALGRSDHFGGTVGAADFSAPDRVVHIDRVYIPEVQPRVEVRAVELELPESADASGQVRTTSTTLIRDGRYCL